MESDSLRPKRLISFSERVAAFPASRNNLGFPSNEDLNGEDTRNAPPSFQNQKEFPSEDIDIRRSLIRWQYHKQRSESTLRSELSQKENLPHTILLPATIICIPIALLAGMLLGLCYLYKIKPVDNLFQPPDDTLHGSGFILVNFPATRLVFVASFLSTLAPLLGSFIMSLYCLPVSRKLLDASENGKYLHLPTPFQMSLLIGVLLASAQQLRSYIWYLLRRRRTAIPPVLHSAALMMLLTFFLAGGVFITDTVLHYTTSTIEFDQISIPPQPEQQLGRGLSEYCLKFNRMRIGFPCSVTFDGTQVNPNANVDAIETSRLFHNTSQTSEIQISAADGIPDDLAYLIPKQQTIIPDTDFKASTIGISTQCRFINPEECQMTLWDDYYSNFSCTDMFHGTLGMPPNVSTNLNDPRPSDPYRAFLMYKPAANLMYSFFNDSSMRNIYNTAGLEDDGNINVNIPPYSDSQLVNPFYMGLAGRISATNGDFMSGSQMLKNDTNSTFPVDASGNELIDFLLSCAVTSYDVSYTWLNGGLGSLDAVPTSNGSILEIYHGSLPYFSITGGDPDMQSFLTQSSLAGMTTESFLREYGSLYSTKVLSVIGGYTSGRLSLAEQQREHMLLSKVPIPPLAILVAWSLSYTLLGLIIAFKAFWASRDNVRDIAAKLSLVGLSQSAFGERRSEQSGGGNGSKEKTANTQSETRRILVDGSAAQGFEFGVMCNDFFTQTPTVAADKLRSITAPPTAPTDPACCAAGCADGFGKRERFAWPRGPFLAPDLCDTRCPGTHSWGNDRNTWWLHDANARYIGAPTGTKLGELTSIYPTPPASTYDAKTIGDAGIAPEASYDPTQDFHAVELAGDDQDTIALILENSSEEPVTLLADLDLTLTENYISSGMLEALGISSTSSHSHRMVTITEADRRVAALGAQALEVRPHANVSLDFLTGPKDALKHFANVNFNVFDLPDPAEDGSFVWQPELFLGVAFLRDAGALRLAEDFAGNPALEGVPVLVRSMKGYTFSSSGEKQAGSKQEDWEKDEL